MSNPIRAAAVWCPDWPVTTARLGSDGTGLGDGTTGRGRLPAADAAEIPVAVLVGNHVLACSHTAREAGVRRGQRRREAQSRCPELIVLARNEAAEARAFEPVVAALESIAPGVEITRPGLAAIGMRGPTRYFGGETGVLHALSRAVGALPVLGGADALIGVADGAFAAEQAARRGLVVEPGESPAFLADLPIETLGLPELAGLLRRLGLRTLGAFAALPARDVLARFGPAGAWAHRQAGGRDDRPVAGRRPPVEFAVTLELEPPVDRVDAVAFSARGIAEQFVTDLAAHGLACACLELQAANENGEETVRRWRHAGVLSTTDVLDRVRWQLEGWLSGHGKSSRPTAGVVRLRLVPIEVVPTGAHQQALWGGPGEGDERARRALARVQTLLGHGSVLIPVLDGGRDPRQRTRLVPWGDALPPPAATPDLPGPPPLATPRTGGGTPTAAARSPQQPWPGQLPAPAPSVLLDPPRPAQVLDDAGRPVVVTERGTVPRPPARFGLGAERPVVITSWAGPWPVDERWWNPDAARHVVRCQLVDVRGRAYLVSGTMTTDDAGTPTGSWQVEAVYD